MPNFNPQPDCCDSSFLACAAYFSIVLRIRNIYHHIKWIYCFWPLFCKSYFAHKEEGLHTHCKLLANHHAYFSDIILITLLLLDESNFIFLLSSHIGYCVTVLISSLDSTVLPHTSNTSKGIYDICAKLCFYRYVHVGWKYNNIILG